MATIELKTVRSGASDPSEAADVLVRALLDAMEQPPRLVLAFVSSERDQAAINAALRERLPSDTRLLGASAAACIDHEGVHDGAILLAGMAGDFEVGIGLGRELTSDAFEAGARAIASAREQLGVGEGVLDTSRHFGLVIDDGLRFQKEELLMGVLEDCPTLNLVGGGASTVSMDPSQGCGHVHVDGEVATDAALVALFRTDAQWAVMRSHCYEPTGRTLRITKVDDSGTRALEIDGQPAAQRYAELIGCPIEELEFGQAGGFSEQPTGMQVGSEIFLRSPWKPLPDGSILFSNLLVEGAEFELMQRTDIVASTQAFLDEELPAKIARPAATLLFHCGGRTWVARALGQAEALRQALASAPHPAGFEVAFEIYRGFAINTTLTVLAFGDTP